MLESLFRAVWVSPTPDHVTRDAITARLSRLGAFVEFRPGRPAVVTQPHDEHTIDVGTVTRHPDGQHTVVVLDTADDHARRNLAALCLMAENYIRTGHTGWRDREVRTHPNGSVTVTVQVAVCRLERLEYLPADRLTAVLCGSLGRAGDALDAAAAFYADRGYRVRRPVRDDRVPAAVHALRWYAEIAAADLVVACTMQDAAIGEQTHREIARAFELGKAVKLWVEPFASVPGVRRG